jgi:hypothetical protein
VGAAQSLVPDGCGGTFSVGVAGLAVNGVIIAAEGDVAAPAELALASPGSVKAAAAMHAPTVAYNLKRKVNSPEYVMRDPV